MKTAFDVPFPAAWTADDLVDAVPRRLSSLFEDGHPAPPAAERVVARLPHLRRYCAGSALPAMFQIR